MSKRKVYKVIESENGKTTIYGSNKWIKLNFNKNDISFRYLGRTYKLSDFMKIDKKSSGATSEFDGYASETNFSSIVIKISDNGEAVKAYSIIVL